MHEFPQLQKLLALLSRFVAATTFELRENGDDLFGRHDQLSLGVGELRQGLLNPYPQDLVDHCWTLLIDPKTAAAFHRSCDGAPNSTVALWPGADADRLHHRACARFASGVAAYWVRQALGDPAATEKLYLWLLRTAGLPESLLDSCRHGPPGGWREPEDRRVYQACTHLGRLTDQSLLDARLRVLHWLGGPLAEVEGYLKVPVAAHDRQAAGCLSDLHLQRLKVESAELVEHPEMWNKPLDQKWGQTLEQAWRKRCSGRAVLWNFSDRDQGGPFSPLCGPSHGAAAHVGLHLLNTGDPYDTGCLLCATVNDQDELEPVDALLDKCQAAQRHGLDLVVLAPGSKLSDADRAGFADGKPPLKIETCITFARAVEWASGLATGLRTYLQSLIAWPDADANRPAYIGKRQLTALYIEPDVLKEERRLDRDDRSPPVKVSAATEFEESLGQFGRANDKRTRVPWHKERKTIRRAVIIGPPGQGKTLLARMTVAELAQDALQQLEQQQQPVHELTLPICLRLPDVARAGSWPEAIRASLNGQHKTIVVDYLCNRWLTDKCWLLLDGLDEVTERKDQLCVLLGELKEENARCQVVLTSRPYGYNVDKPPWGQISEYDLAPLTPEQRRKFISRWFTGSDDPQKGEGIRDLIQMNPKLGDMTGNALLLALTCAVSEDHNIDPQTTRRVDLYEHILRDMAQGRWRTAPMADNSNLSNFLLDLQEIAWELFQKNPGGNLFHDQKDYVPVVRRVVGKEKTDWILDRLRWTGLVVEPQSGHSMFAHTTFLEYLASCHVASLPKPAEEIQRFLGQFNDKASQQGHSTFAEVTNFLASMLTSPLPLLKVLAEKTKNDYFSSPLVSALQEIQGLPCDNAADLSSLEQVADVVARIWLEHRQQGTWIAGKSAERALHLVADVHSQVMNTPFAINEMEFARAWDIGNLRLLRNPSERSDFHPRKDVELQSLLRKQEPDLSKNLLNSESGKRRLLTVEFPLFERYNDSRNKEFKIRVAKVNDSLVFRYKLKPCHNVFELETWLGPDFPYVPPETRVLTPLKNCPHLLEGQTVCMWRQGSKRTNRWDPARFTAVFAVQAAWRWLACYEVWYVTGEWPLPMAE